ncbi:unnamed protein product, partial [Durusdinium trenchii]
LTLPRPSESGIGTMVAFQLRLCHVGHCSTFLVTSKFGKDTTKAKRHIFQYVDYNHLPPNEQKRGTIIRGFRPHPWFQVDHRFQVMCFPGTEELYDEILDRLRNIPDQVWQKDGRRLNVLPEGETRSKQLILGLVTAQAFRNLPTISKETWCLSQLTKILLVYINRLAKENGWGKIHGSTLQLTKNLQTVEHQDQNNGGKSYGTTFGEHTGGGLWVEDANGEEQVAFPAHLKKEGSPEVLRGNRHQPRRALVQFDGNRIHCTCPFQGERYAVILFGLKPGAMEKTSELNQAFLSILGFNLGLGGPPPSHQHLELGRRAAFRQRVDYHPPRVPPMFTRGKKRKTA